MSADEKIKELVESADNPKNIVVVTNDRDIQSCVRRLQARIKTVQEFTNIFKALPPSNSPENRPKLSAESALRITDEMKKLWL